MTLFWAETIALYIYIYEKYVCLKKYIHVYETNYQAIALIIHVLVLVVFINMFLFSKQPKFKSKRYCRDSPTYKYIYIIYIYIIYIYK